MNMLRVLGLKFLIASIVVASSEEPTCESCERGAEGAESLLQTKSSGLAKATVSLPGEVLPPALHDLGVKTFGSEEALLKAVTESTVQNIGFAGIPMAMHFAAGDDAVVRLGLGVEAGNEYGLETLLSLRESEHAMLNMVDIGGNYGAVTIAMYKKFPGMLRAVMVEASPVTYFFMRWNMMSNGVDYLTKEEFQQDPHRPGVVALMGAVADEDGKDLTMCLQPGSSMNAYSADASKEMHGVDCDCSVATCAKVPGVGAATLLDGYFGKAPISLLKMDCEGCEVEVLPVLARKSDRIKRFVGELHLPHEELIETACTFDGGKYFSKVCKTGPYSYEGGHDLGCGIANRVPCKQ